MREVIELRNRVHALEAKCDRLQESINAWRRHFNDLKDQRDMLLKACKSVVHTWESAFKGQETGYEGTPLEEDYKECKAALRQQK